MEECHATEHRAPTAAYQAARTLAPLAVLDGDEQLWQVEDLGPPRFVLGSALRLGVNLILELREQCSPVGSSVLGRQLRADEAPKTVFPNPTAGRGQNFLDLSRTIRE